ncbi:hypothetical protein TNCV_3594041 [Trichonephila clavipes]|nr:hypothetical protein TNCV_3594041 [Trichonephila clavipes]
MGHARPAPEVTAWGAIFYSNEGTLEGMFPQQDNVYPHTAIVTHHALQNIDVLPRHVRLKDLSPMEYEWGIIGQHNSNFIHN